jgi:hypothetical protein
VSGYPPGPAEPGNRLLFRVCMRKPASDPAFGRRQQMITRLA